MLKHKHLIMSATIQYAPKDPEYVKSWIALLIRHIDMQVAPIEGNPMAYYCSTPGNTGITGGGILETSHCMVHIWDEVSPAKMEFDLYSCSDFKPEDILPFINLFEPLSIEYKFLDRENGLNLIIEDKDIKKA